MEPIDHVKRRVESLRETTENHLLAGHINSVEDLRAVQAKRAAVIQVLEIIADVKKKSLEED